MTDPNTQAVVTQADRWPTIWLIPEQGDPFAGEWQWTNDLDGYDTEEVAGAVRYVRAHTTPPADAEMDALVERLAEQVQVGIFGMDKIVTYEACLTTIQSLRTKLAEAEAPGVWHPIETAKKDGTPIWALFHPSIYPGLRPQREDLERWNGVQACIRHPGVADDGFDMGWNMAAPVGHGGIPDAWIVGWRPLPAALTDAPAKEQGQ